eukprot:TRINITY_DN49_c0_g1_i1.p1 TRINITY_DN49_c0_g1~~TRINITY_DN49_c0_g1_i1.p1  ORF type:complete len:802 (+),score=299.38 TRINITY_DN49_c0_g1_i1:46-2451(+)
MPARRGRSQGSQRHSQASQRRDRVLAEDSQPGDGLTAAVAALQQRDVQAAAAAFSSLRDAEPPAVSAVAEAGLPRPWAAVLLADGGDAAALLTASAPAAAGLAHSAASAEALAVVLSASADDLNTRVLAGAATLLYAAAAQHDLCPGVADGTELHTAVWDAPLERLGSAVAEPTAEPAARRAAAAAVGGLLAVHGGDVADAVALEQLCVAARDVDDVALQVLVLNDVVAPLTVRCRPRRQRRADAVVRAVFGAAAADSWRRLQLPTREPTAELAAWVSALHGRATEQRVAALQLRAAALYPADEAAAIRSATVADMHASGCGWWAAVSKAGLWLPPCLLQRCGAAGWPIGLLEATPVIVPLTSLRRVQESGGRRAFDLVLKAAAAGPLFSRMGDGRLRLQLTAADDDARVAFGQTLKRALAAAGMQDQRARGKRPSSGPVPVAARPRLEEPPEAEPTEPAEVVVDAGAVAPLRPDPPPRAAAAPPPPEAPVEAGAGAVAPLRPDPPQRAAAALPPAEEADAPVRAADTPQAARQPVPGSSGSGRKRVAQRQSDAAAQRKKLQRLLDGLGHPPNCGNDELPASPPAAAPAPAPRLPPPALTPPRREQGDGAAADSDDGSEMDALLAALQQQVKRQDSGRRCDAVVEQCYRSVQAAVDEYKRDAAARREGAERRLGEVLRRHAELEASVAALRAERTAAEAECSNAASEFDGLAEQLTCSIAAVRQRMDGCMQTWDSSVQGTLSELKEEVDGRMQELVRLCDEAKQPRRALVKVLEECVRRLEADGAGFGSKQPAAAPEHGQL